LDVSRGKQDCNRWVSAETKDFRQEFCENLIMTNSHLIEEYGSTENDLIATVVKPQNIRINFLTIKDITILVTGDILKKEGCSNTP